MRSICVLLLLLFCAVILSMTTIVVQAQTQSWDDRSDFSLDKNPNGVWTYGYLDKDGCFAPYNSIFNLGDGIVGWAMNDDPDFAGNVTINTSAKTVEKFGIVWEPGQICLHPGLFGCKVVFRWTSPVSGTISLNANIAGQSKHGAPANVEIKYKDESVTEAVVEGFAGVGEYKSGRFGDEPEQDFSSAIYVNKGETIDIVVSDTQIGVVGHIAINAAIIVTEKG
ncbi:hypothetical protein LLG46_07120 [bacterium]|nr:hypothetical protein [bacterium]